MAETETIVFVISGWDEGPAIVDPHCRRVGESRKVFAHETAQDGAAVPIGGLGRSSKARRSSQSETAKEECAELQR